MKILRKIFAALLYLKKYFDNDLAYENYLRDFSEKRVEGHVEGDDKKPLSKKEFFLKKQNDKFGKNVSRCC